MGNQNSTRVNEVQALLNAVRRNAGEAGGIEISGEIEATAKLITKSIEKSTNSAGEQLLQDLKLKFISEIIKTDKIETFMEVMEEGYLKVTAPMGRLQLTPLHIAAFHNSLNILKYLLQLPQVLVNSPSKDKDTALNLGLIGAESDAAAMQIIRIFQKRRDLNIFCKNQKHSFPLLITVQRKFAGASKLLLTSSSSQGNHNHCNAMDNYEIWDLILVIKLALITDQDNLINFIQSNLGVFKQLQILQEIKDKSFVQEEVLGLLDDLVNLLKKTVVEGTTNKHKQENTHCRNRSRSNDELREFDIAHIGTGTATGTETGIGETNNAMRPSILEPTSTTTLFQQTIDDAGGNPLRVGNIVKTLSARYVKRGLPPDANEADILRVADKEATIHEISASGSGSGNTIYIEIHVEQCVARLKADAAIFLEEGMSEVLGDGSVGRVGSFVQVLAHEEDVRKLTGIVGWVHGMGDTCGKAGRIVRILGNSDILVQFAWGVRFYFEPGALLQSSSDKVETQDYKNNWIHIGSLIRITKSPSEFEEIQKQNKLPHDDRFYSQLPYKFGLVNGIRLKAFSASKTVRIVHRGRAYSVSVECIELVTSVKDRKGVDVRVGDTVQVLKNKVALKALQKDKPEFGGWIEGMLDVLGEVGKVTQFCIHEMSEANAVMVKVEFPDSSCFYFNPRVVAVQKQKDAVLKNVQDKKGNIKKNVDGKTGGAPVPVPIPETATDEFEWEKIDPKDLKCFEDLGKGGFGRVVRGQWTKNGEMQDVAIKIIPPRALRNRLPADTVLKEANIQFSMRHPNIVALFGMSMSAVSPDLWIVMDLVDGTDLYTLLFLDNNNTGDNALTLRQEVKMSLDMCNAIAYIHQKRYVHCDIKPHNMMVDRTSGKVYVCDFGISKFLGDMDVMSTFTHYTNNFGGTRYYISPECLQTNPTTRQFRSPTFSTDVWALGAVLYELFSHRPLSDNYLAFYEDKIQNNDTMVKSQLKNLPETVRPIVSKALDFNRKARPTAQELYEVFHELLLRLTIDSQEVSDSGQEKWEKIDRTDLKCFEVLGESLHGLIVRGEWKSKGTNCKKHVAIKQVRNSDKGSLEEALKDASIQFSLKHANIVALLGISLERDLWIVMDFVEGTSLYTMLFTNDGNDNSLTFKKKMKLSLDMCSAIAYMHANGYLHGDIKPQNMLVEEKSGTLYITEFASSQFLGLGDPASSSKKTEFTDDISGTLYYISPECLQPDAVTGKYRKCTFAVDIWALGAVLFELFTQTHLYDRNNHVTFLQDKLSNDDSTVRKKVDSFLVGDIKGVVSRALSFNPSDRPSALVLSNFFQKLMCKFK